MSKEKLNAFYELINGFEIVGTLTEDGKKFIKEGVQHLQQENQKLKELKYKFFDASGDEESFTLEDYLDLSNKVYDLEQENQQLKEENYGLEHNEKVLLQREERAINYIDQVIGYKPCAKEIDEELNTLIGILKGGNNEQ